MKKMLLLLLVPLLCSCSQKPKDEIVVKSQTATPEVVEGKRGEVFTYGQTVPVSTLRLTFSSDPAPLNDGYIRLVGIIAGESPVACVEISGRGEDLGVGDEVGQYIVGSINKKEVVLCLKK